MFFDIHYEYIRSQDGLNKTKKEFYNQQIQDYIIIKSAVINIYPLLKKILKESIDDIARYQKKDHLKVFIYLNGQFKGFIEDEVKAYNNINQVHLNNFINLYLKPFIKKIENNIHLNMTTGNHYLYAIIDLYEVLYKIENNLYKRLNKCQKISIFQKIKQLFKKKHK